MSESAQRREELPLLLIGVDHRTAPLELRERVALSASDCEEILVRLLARPAVAEAWVLSTCNRTEVLLRARDEEAAYQAACELVYRPRAAEIESEGRLYVHRGADAAKHLMAVACGLESMVLGEPEVLGQVRQAAGLADAVGASGTLVRRLLRAGAAAGARARRDTAIGAGAVSLGYAVVELAESIFSALDSCSVLVLGAGDTARQVARSLGERGAGWLRFANRSAQRAAAFRREFPHAKAIPFAERLEAVRASDVVVASTAATEPILSRAELEAALRRRPARPMLIVDLGVPRNVDPEAGRLGNVFLHHLDSLQHLIERTLRRRREEVPRVEALLDQELERFLAWYRSLEAEPLVARLQRRADRIRRDELERALTSFPPETHGELDRLTRSLVRKILHHPSAGLRARTGEDSLPRLDLVRELFRLDEPAESEDPTGEE
ncbi:MAG TPA: glutamyl-tRNA reductase [Thermoanaerobaculia bacterium]|nr:glutamyl-tRNA reductase [Thermoanaerobaculia bacterium]